MDTDLTTLEADLAADEYAGQGGAYEVRDGKRVLIERTAEPLPEPAAGALLAASTDDPEAVPPLTLGLPAAPSEPTHKALA